MKTYQRAINNGFFLGIALIACSYVLYYVNPDMFVEAKSSVLIFVFILVLFKTGTELRRENNGILKFFPGFKHMFVTGALAVFLCTSFEYVLYNFIDPNLIEIQRALELERFELSKNIFNDKFEPVIKETLNEIKTGNNSSIDKMILKYLIRLVAPVGFFASFIALIIQRKAPFQDLKKKP